MLLMSKYCQTLVQTYFANKRQHKEELVKRGKETVTETIYAHNYGLKDLTKIVTSLGQESLNLS